MLREGKGSLRSCVAGGKAAGDVGGETESVVGALRASKGRVGGKKSYQGGRGKVVWCKKRAIYGKEVTVEEKGRARELGTR